VRVFEDETANAVALPGKKIGVHTGLLAVAKNQDQLATVLAHEVAHVVARHSAERVSDQIAIQGGAQLAGAVIGAAGDPSSPLHGIALGALGLGAQGVVLKFSRTHESEADKLGLDLMARAGFDPRESVPLWQNMEAAAKGARPPEFLSTHPSPATRIRDLQQRIPQTLPVAEQAWAGGRKPRCQ
jgi:predicted Zn-dependent protease